jgi:hypothetical protein
LLKKKNPLKRRIIHKKVSSFNVYLVYGGYMEHAINHDVKLLKAVAKVQAWEVLNLNLLRKESGRQLYFGLLRHISESSGCLHVSSMKDIYCDEGVQLTERALRLAFRAFEDEGVVVVEKSYSDQRLRKIFLTRKFQDLMATHALEIKKKIDESFIVLSK